MPAATNSWAVEWYDGCSWNREGTFATRAEAQKRKVREEIKGCIPFRVRDLRKPVRR